MNRQGVCYDVGRCFGGPTTRPVLDLNTVRGELQIIRDDLHANAVRICGAEISRVMSVAEEALQHGLEAWLCPELFEHDPEQTLQYIAEAAHAAEGLRRDWPGQVVLSLGTELTLFMQGIFEGDRVTERISRPSFLQRLTDGTHNPPLNAFLAKANHAARQAFGGPVTYASAPLESVDWTLFDYVSVDAYRDGRSREAYAKLISPYFATDVRSSSPRSVAAPIAAPRTPAAWAGRSSTTRAPRSGSATATCATRRCRRAS